MSKFKIDPLPEGFNTTGCTMARAPALNSIIFIKTSDGKIYHASNFRGDVDMAREFESSAADRRLYAKLAGIKVKEIDEARKAEKLKLVKERKASDLRWLKRHAARLGLKLVKQSDSGT